SSSSSHPSRASSPARLHLARSGCPPKRVNLRMAHPDRVRTQPHHHSGMRIQTTSTPRNPGHTKVSGNPGAVQSATCHPPSSRPFTPPPTRRHDQHNRPVRETGSGSPVRDTGSGSPANLQHSHSKPTCPAQLSHNRPTLKETSHRLGAIAPKKCRILRILDLMIDFPTTRAPALSAVRLKRRVVLAVQPLVTDHRERPQPE